jgi:DNA-directed RNA polymerase specialized sigma24 family protein
MADDPADESLRSRLLRGDDAAWAVVYAEVVPKAVAKIRARFGPGERWISAEEAVASACRTTFRRLKEGLLASGLECYDDVLNLLTLVARNKLIDGLRKAGAEARWAATARAAAEQGRAEDARQSPVLSALCWAEASHQMDACLAKLDAALAGETERLVFRGKLDGLTEREIAERVEAEHGGRMTVFMVREHWRAVRARFRRLIPEHLDEPVA